MPSERAIEQRGLLERAAELAILRARREAAAEAQGSVVVVQGPAGIGKTALLAAAARDAAAAGFAVLAAAGTELERELGFGVARQLLERPFRGLDGPLVGAAQLAVPVLSAPPVGAPPTAELYAPMHGLYWLAVELAARRPLLLAVDDAQWADAPSLRWLAYLGRRLEGVPLLLVVAHREGEPGGDGELLERVLGDTLATRLNPPGLTAAAVEQWLSQAYEAAPAAEFVTACCAATGGNPLLLRELTASLRAEGTPPDDGAAARVQRIAPASLARSVLLRLAPLGPEAAALAEAAAVLSTDARLDLVARLAGVPEERAAALADSLAAAGILTDDAPLQFQHPILQAAVYQQMPPLRRGLAHLSAAEALLAEPERAAAHLLLAPPGARAWAVEALREAAAVAARRGAPEAAVSLLRRALAEGSADRAGVLLELASIEALVQDPQAVAHAREAAELAETPTQAAEATLVAAQALTLASRFTEATDVVRSAQRHLEALEPRVQRHVEAQALVLSLWHGGVTGLGTRLDDLRVDDLHDDSPSALILLGLRVLELVTSGREPAAVSQALIRRLLAHEQLPRDENTLFTLTRCLAMTDALDETRAVLDPALDDARRRGAVFTVALGTALRADVELRAGRLAQAESDAREALALSAEHGVMLALPAALAALVELLLDRGPPREALDQFGAYGLDGALPPAYTAYVLQYARGRARLAAGDLEAAAADLRSCGEALIAWGDLNATNVPWRSTLALSLGPGDEALALVADELRRAERFGALRAIGIAQRARALLARGEAQIEGLREAVETLAASPARLEEARARHDLGAALRRAGQRVEARETLAAALDQADRCGAHRLAAAAREELVAAGARPRRERVSGPEALTAAERRVAALAADGHTNREIAQALFVTTKTVEMHLGRVYPKLGIAGRGELSAALGETLG